jgi:hypothetical protein
MITFRSYYAHGILKMAAFIRRCSQYAPLKRRSPFTSLYVTISRKAVILFFVGVRTWNRTWNSVCLRMLRELRSVLCKRSVGLLCRPIWHRRNIGWAIFDSYETPGLYIGGYLKNKTTLGALYHVSPVACGPSCTRISCLIQLEEFYKIIHSKV